MRRMIRFMLHPADSDPSEGLLLDAAVGRVTIYDAARDADLRSVGPLKLQRCAARCGGGRFDDRDIVVAADGTGNGVDGGTRSSSSRS